MNFFDHKDLGNHLLQLCPKVVKHPGYRDTAIEVTSRITWAMHSPFKAYQFLYVRPVVAFKNSTWRSLCVECFVRISEQTATFALYIID